MLVSLSFVMADNENTNISSEANKTTTISGKIIDIKTGESIVGACITIEGSNLKVYTDLDGNYEINNLKAGIYKLNVNMISYKEKTEIPVNTNNGNKIEKNIIIEPEL